MSNNRNKKDAQDSSFLSPTHIVSRSGRRTADTAVNDSESTSVSSSSFVKRNTSLIMSKQETDRLGQLGTASNSIVINKIEDAMSPTTLSRQSMSPVSPATSTAVDDILRRAEKNMNTVRQSSHHLADTLSPSSYNEAIKRAEDIQSQKTSTKFVPAMPELKHSFLNTKGLASTRSARDPTPTAGYRPDDKDDSADYMTTVNNILRSNSSNGDSLVPSFDYATSAERSFGESGRRDEHNTTSAHYHDMTSPGLREYGSILADPSPLLSYGDSRNPNHTFTFESGVNAPMPSYGAGEGSSYKRVSFSKDYSEDLGDSPVRSYGDSEPSASVTGSLPSYEERMVRAIANNSLSFSKSGGSERSETTDKYAYSRNKSASSTYNDKFSFDKVTTNSNSQRSLSQSYDQPDLSENDNEPPANVMSEETKRRGSVKAKLLAAVENPQSYKMLDGEVMQQNTDDSKTSYALVKEVPVTASTRSSSNGRASHTDQRGQQRRGEKAAPNHHYIDDDASPSPNMSDPTLVPSFSDEANINKAATARSDRTGASREKPFQNYSDLDLDYATSGTASSGDQTYNKNLDLKNNDNSFHVLANLLLSFFETKLVNNGQALLLHPGDRDQIERLLPRSARLNFIEAVRYRIGHTSHDYDSPIDNLTEQCRSLHFDREGAENPILVGISITDRPMLVSISDEFAETLGRQTMSVDTLDNRDTLLSVDSENSPQSFEQVQSKDTLEPAFSDEDVDSPISQSASEGTNSAASPNSEPGPTHTFDDTINSGTYGEALQSVSFDGSGSEKYESPRSGGSMDEPLHDNPPKYKTDTLQSISDEYVDAHNAPSQYNEPSFSKSASYDDNYDNHSEHEQNSAHRNDNANNSYDEHSRSVASVSASVDDYNSQSYQDDVSEQQRVQSNDTYGSQAPSFGDSYRQSNNTSTSLSQHHPARMQAAKQTLSTAFVSQAVVGMPDGHSVESLPTDGSTEFMQRQQLLAELREATNLMAESVTPETAKFWRDHVLDLQARLRALNGESSSTAENSDSQYSDNTERILARNKQLMNKYESDNDVPEHVASSPRKSKKKSDPKLPSKLVLTSDYEAPFVDVVAPADLPAGYHFEAELNGERFLATVPPGGIKQGETFTCVMKDIKSVSMDIPVGYWKDDITDVFRYGCYHPVFWNSIFCPQIVVGQVASRLNLDFLGRPKIGSYGLENRSVMLLITIFWIGMNLALFAGYNYKWSRNMELTVPDLTAFVMINLAMWCFVVFMTQSTRSSLRDQFMIREQRCNDLEDLCCSAFCLPCTACQMSRHTANYDDYEAVCCSKNGLPDGVQVNLAIPKQNSGGSQYIV